MPHAIDGFRTKPELTAEQFTSDKNELFGEYLCHTKLYNIPDDLHILKSQFRTTELAC